MILKISPINPVYTGRKLNVHNTFRRRSGRLLNVLCTFNLRPVSTGKQLQKWKHFLNRSYRSKLILPLVWNTYQLKIGKWLAKLNTEKCTFYFSFYIFLGRLICSPLKTSIALSIETKKLKIFRTRWGKKLLEGNIAQVAQNIARHFLSLKYIFCWKSYSICWSFFWKIRKDTFFEEKICAQFSRVHALTLIFIRKIVIP